MSFTKRVPPALRLLACLLLACAVTSGCAHSHGGNLVVPERPVLNDLKCLTLSPYYVPKNIVSSWIGLQIEAASFFDSTAEFSSGRKISVPEKVAYGVVVMPVHVVVSAPIAVIAGGVMPFAGHVVDLFTAPFGAPLPFDRLDGSGFAETE